MISSTVRSFRVNNPPKVDSIADLTAYTGKEFSFKVKGSDLDPEDTGDLEFTLIRYPEGMSLNRETGAIKWVPNDNQLGDRAVEIVLTDGIESVKVEFSINVLQSEEKSFPLSIIVISIVIILVVLVGIGFFLGRRKGEHHPVVTHDETDEVIADMERHRKEEQEFNTRSQEVVHSDVPLTAAEAHSLDTNHKPQSYEDLYGAPAPKLEEGLTTAELKDEIGNMARELEDEMNKRHEE